MATCDDAYSTIHVEPITDSPWGELLVEKLCTVIDLSGFAGEIGGETEIETPLYLLMMTA